MRSTTYGTGQFEGHVTSHFTPAGLLAAIVGKWQDHRRLRDLESLPFTVMKDIGFRAAERADAK